MSFNQSAQQASVRGVTSTTDTDNADWLALFTARSASGATFNERLLSYINGKLTTSYTSLPTAMQAFAVNQGAANWNSMGTFTP